MQLEFYFKYDQGPNSTQGAGGYVGMAVSTDAAQSPPSSKQIAEVFNIKSLGFVGRDQKCVVPKNLIESATKQKHFVRGLVLPGGVDIHTYDCGQLFFWTQGEAGATEVGELRVRYKVKLMNPVLETSTTAPVNNQVSWFQSAGNQACTTSVPVTSANATATTNGLAIVNTAGSFVPAVGNYLVDFTAQCKDTSAEAFSDLSDFQKNGVSVYSLANNKPTFICGASIGACSVPLSGSVFVTANGTDAFTQVLTLVGAAGTLTADTSVRWTAI